MTKGVLVPEKSFLLCEKLDNSNITKSGFIVTKDKKKANFSSYKVLDVGYEIAEDFKKGEIILADEDNVNELTFKGKNYCIISDTFIVAKEK